MTEDGGWRKVGNRAVFPQNRNCKWDRDCLEQTRGNNDDIDDDHHDRNNDFVSNTWNQRWEIVTATTIDNYTRCFKYLCLAWNTTSVPDEEGSSTHACYDHWDCVEGMVSFCLYSDFQLSTWFSFPDLPEARGRRDRQGVLHQRACWPSRLCWQQRLLRRVSITFLFPQHKNKNLFTMNPPKIRTSGWYKKEQTFSMPQAGLCPPWIVWRPKLSCHSPTVALPGQLSDWSIV